MEKNYVYQTVSYYSKYPEFWIVREKMKIKLYFSKKMIGRSYAFMVDIK